MRENILAAIDVGSSKVCTLVAEVTPGSCNCTLFTSGR
jgi:cell division ATPase FtsA